jgi:DNA-binding CsgD family transcriptional regulator
MRGKKTVPPRLDPLAILEAAYKVDSPRWLEGLLHALQPSLDRGLGLCAFTYDASIPGKLALGEVVEVGVATPISASGMGRAILAGVDAKFVRSTYRTKVCGLASEEAEFTTPQVRSFAERCGFQDVQVLNALDPTGKGLVVATYLPRITKFTAKEIDVWTRTAAHVSAAYRLRRRMRARARAKDARPDAILTTRGSMEEGDVDAIAARTVLRDAVVAYGRAKGALRADERAVDGWPVLVDRRWTLLDGFESGGSRYVIARRNDAPAKGPAALTRRERQVLACVALGHENKMVAYTLGISHATVRVLVARAAAKLGVRTRGDLIAAFLRSTDDPQPP